MAAARTATLSIRVSRADLARLAALAEHYNLDRASVVRMLLKRDADAVERRVTALRKPDGKVRRK